MQEQLDILKVLYIKIAAGFLYLTIMGFIMVREKSWDFVPDNFVYLWVTVIHSFKQCNGKTSKRDDVREFIDCNFHSFSQGKTAPGQRKVREFDISTIICLIA